MSDQNINESMDADSNSKKSSAFDDFKKKFLGIIDSGVEASKKGIKTAGSAISDFGDKSVVRIELTQLNSKLEKTYRELGEAVARRLCTSDAADKEQSVTAQEEPIAGYLSVISTLKDEISHREALLKSEEKK